MPSLLRKILSGYCVFSALVVSSFVGFYIFRISTRPSGEIYFSLLNQSVRATISNLQFSKSVSFKSSDPMFRIITYGISNTVNQRQSWGKCHPITTTITYFDQNDTKILVFEYDGKHLQCGKDVFDCDVPFHLLFLDSDREGGRVQK